MDKIGIGEKSKKLRGERNRERIAEAVGVTKSAWAMYERGERVPRDNIKIKIANYFNVSVEKLFFES